MIGYGEGYVREYVSGAQACRGREDAVQRCYEALLAVRGGEEAGDALHRPALRLRLLRSLLWLLRRAGSRLRERAPSLAGLALLPGARRVARGPARGLSSMPSGCRPHAQLLLAAAAAHAREAHRLPERRLGPAQRWVPAPAGWRAPAAARAAACQQARWRGPWQGIPWACVQAACAHGV